MLPLARNISLVLSAFAALMSLYSLVSGLPYTRMFEDTVGSVTVYRPAPILVLPLIFSGINFFGLIQNQPGVAWVGAGLLAAFTGLFFFSVGLRYSPVVLLLLITMGVWQLAARSHR